VVCVWICVYVWCVWIVCGVCVDCACVCGFVCMCGVCVDCVCMCGVCVWIVCVDCVCMYVCVDCVCMCMCVCVYVWGVCVDWIHYVAQFQSTVNTLRNSFLPTCLEFLDLRSNYQFFKK
jgi:hypothetical protein